MNVSISQGGIPPRGVGIGLRAPHVAQVLATRPHVPWFEVHTENYFDEGGAARDALDAVAEHYPLSLHGVGLSLGGTDPLDRAHLAKVKRLVDRLRPALVSEHASWGSVRGRHFNDLLPLPYTRETLGHLAERVCAVQDALGRRILVENISTYYRFPESVVPEAEFLACLSIRTGCGLILDVNNVYVDACNHGLDARAFLRTLPRDAVGEMHLAGFERRGGLLVDTHGARVDPAVWSLYEEAVARFGEVPTLVEWDTDIPDFAVLLEEAARASVIQGARHDLAA